VQKYSAGEPSGVIVEGAPYFRPGDLCDTDLAGYQAATLRGTCGPEWGDLVGKRFVLLDAGAALEVVGRVKHCQKLSNGEFVSPEAIEAALDKAAPTMIASFVVHVDEANDRVVALVVPRDLTLSRSETSCDRAEAGLLAAFATLGSSAGLAAHEIPKAVAILSAAWSAESGTLTPSNKVDRAGIVLKFKADLQRIGVGVSGGSRKEQSVDARVCAYLTATPREQALQALGSDVDDVTLDLIGGDSIAAARIAGSFPGRLTIAQVVSLPLSEIWRCVHTGTTSTGPTAQFWSAEAVWAPLVSTRVRPTVRPPCARKTLLITGVTGFIGPHLLSALASHGRWSNVIALVRPPIERSLYSGGTHPLMIRISTNGSLNYESASICF
jgi:hypothetical protein